MGCEPSHSCKKSDCWLIAAIYRQQSLISFSRIVSILTKSISINKTVSSSDDAKEYKHVAIYSQAMYSKELQSICEILNKWLKLENS